MVAVDEQCWRELVTGADHSGALLNEPSKGREAGPGGDVDNGCVFWISRRSILYTSTNLYQGLKLLHSNLDKVHNF